MPRFLLGSTAQNAIDTLLDFAVIYRSIKGEKDPPFLTVKLFCCAQPSDAVWCPG